MQISTNRLIIIGNGFDLANGYKTKYEDFLIEFLKEEIRNFKKKAENSTISLVKVEINNTDTNLEPIINKINNIQDLFKNEQIQILFEGRSRNILRSNPKIILDFRNSILDKLLIDENWTNLEVEYFNLLLEVYNNSKQSSKTKIKLRLNHINNQFEFLKNSFIKYLAEINNKINQIELKFLDPDNKIDLTKLFINLSITEIDRYYLHNIKVDPTIRKKFKSKEISSSNIPNFFILNFNYTDLFFKFLQKIGRPDTAKASIHGIVKEPESIIFGYGDDSHEKYHQLENSNIEEYLHNIKSFYYPNSTGYMDLMNFLDRGPFDVHVVGHSLGLSDRVLLKSIFENQNCFLIKLYHRGTKKDQVKKRFSLSRHFSDKQLMRNKIAEFNNEDVFLN